MFSRILDDNTEVRLTVPTYAEELFALTNQNRQFLRRWLPWLDHVTKVEHTKSFIDEQLERFARGEALHISIFHQGSLAGVLGFNQIDQVNKIGYIGYWLGEKYNGKGLMTISVKDLIQIGRDYYDLEKFDIRAATQNASSRAIPTRLGFKHEGTIRHAEKVYDQWFDHEVYGLVVGDVAMTNLLKTQRNGSPTKKS